MTDKGQALERCTKGCGRMLKAAGRSHHEKYCTGPGYLPGYSKKRRIERRITAPPQQETRYTGEEDMVYELFYEDAALFTTAVYLLEARDGTEIKDVIHSLEAAKAALDTKIRFLKR